MNDRGPGVEYLKNSMAVDVAVSASQIVEAERHRVSLASALVIAEELLKVLNEEDRTESSIIDSARGLAFSLLQIVKIGNAD